MAQSQLLWNYWTEVPLPFSWYCASMTEAEDIHYFIHTETKKCLKENLSQTLCNRITVIAHWQFWYLHINYTIFLKVWQGTGSKILLRLYLPSAFFHDIVTKKISLFCPDTVKPSFPVTTFQINTLCRQGSIQHNLFMVFEYHGFWKIKYLSAVSFSLLRG